MKLYITFPDAIPLIISVTAMPNFCQTQIGRDHERVIMSANNEGGTVSPSNSLTNAKNPSAWF